MLIFYEKQREQALKILFYVLFTLAFCLLSIQLTFAADGVCSSTYNGTTQTTLSSTQPLCSVGTVSDFQNSGGNGPWVWKCLGTEAGDNFTYCSAYLNGAYPLNVSCFPTKINTNNTSNVSCMEDHGYSVLWYPSWWSAYSSAGCTTSSTNFSADYSSLNFVGLNCPSAIATFPVSVYSGDAPQDIFNFSVVTTAINGECNPAYD